MKEKAKVLLVDDESDFRQVMSFWLESKGYTVVMADNGDNAISMFKEHHPDIILMDINMPVMDGIESVKKIRALDKQVPVIIISAYLDDKRINEVRKEGLSGVFYKGTNFQEGLALLESALRTHK